MYINDAASENQETRLNPDLVTEMHLIKHPFREKGIGAKAGRDI